MKEVLRLLNGVAARRVIQYLKESGFESSLFKLRGEVRERNHKHSVWHHHSDSLEIVGEETFRQKVEYIHQNPVRQDWLNGLKIIFFRALGCGVGRLWIMSRS